MNFNYYIGIDQTGAVNSKGLPKPLWVSIIRSKDQKTWINQQIKALTHEEILLLLERIGLKLKKLDRVLICVDAVLGLSQELNITPNDIIKKAQNFSHNNKNYGAETASAFYRSFLSEEQNIILPQRLVEIQFKANSVFLLKPYQRNIGCGSYRIMKNLSQGKKWFSIWPFENIGKSKFVIAEGYPSYYWKIIFKQSSRNIEFFKNSSLQFKNLDQADSYVLAYSAKILFNNYGIIDLSERQKKEGWLWGIVLKNHIND